MQDGWTALMIAAEKGHVNVVQYLVEAGANLEAVDTVRFFHLLGICTFVSHHHHLLHLTFCG